MPWYAILAIVAIVLTIVAISFSIAAMSMSSGSSESKLHINKEAFSARDGIVHVRGISTERYKSKSQATIIDDSHIISHAISDGHSTLSEGNLNIAKDITCGRFVNGSIIMEDGNFTSSGTLTADHLMLNRSISVPAELYAKVFILDMNPVQLPAINAWTPINESSSVGRMFFPGNFKLDHGISLNHDNTIQFHQPGRWQYSFSFLFQPSGVIHAPVVGVAISVETPQLVDGFGVVGNENFTIDGSGVFLVEDTDHAYKFWLQHVKSIAAQGLTATLQLDSAHVFFRYIGR